MGRAVGDFVLRRTKDKVLADLPPKLFRDAELDLTPAQRETYSLAEDEGVLRLTEMGDAATIQHVFELVLRLKQICNFDPATGESAKLERLGGRSGRNRRQRPKSHRLQPMGRHARPLGRRIVGAASAGVSRPDSAAPPRRRSLSNFATDVKRHVMLMSYGAGGVGLNLQFCSYVFLFDRWWNPAVEDQAINRAHRIGVAGPVTVTRFLTARHDRAAHQPGAHEKRELFDTIFTETRSHRSWASRSRKSSACSNSARRTGRRR